MDSKNSAATEVLEKYLEENFPCKITNVTVHEESIKVVGTSRHRNQTLYLGHIPMEFLLGRDKPYESVIPFKTDSRGSFRLAISRVQQREGREYDRLTSRWRVFHQSGTEYKPISHAKYADDVYCHNPDLPPAKFSSKKGIGGWNPRRLPKHPDELKELGVSAVTVNMNGIHQFATLAPSKGSEPFKWQGKTYFANTKSFAKFDAIFREAEESQLVVSAILLITNPGERKDPRIGLLAHPDADKDGKFGMPNVTSTQSIEFYGAILNFMAERWSKENGKHGRIHHWIVHNEVDAGWEWTNIGEKSAIQYMDIYIRSMRLIDLIARQYDPNARAFISLTHHWAQPGNEKWYGSRRLLNLLSQFCEAEGDFPWGLAHHPYPQDLRNPRTWEDNQATFNFNTAKITPKNLEVLDAFMKLPSMRYRRRIRQIHLSENGFNSKDYSPKSLEDQAAGMALAWKKMESLSSIKCWHYHNWIDNRHEGGLRIGLRKFPDDPDDPNGEKPIWHLYKALGTTSEDRVCSQYLKTIGIRFWKQILYPKKIR